MAKATEQTHNSAMYCTCTQQCNNSNGHTRSRNNLLRNGKSGQGILWAEDAQNSTKPEGGGPLAGQLTHDIRKFQYTMP